MDSKKATDASRSKDSYPQCRYLDLKKQAWVDFKEFFLVAKGTKEVIMRYINKDSSCQDVLQREVDYNFNASYARVLPSDLLDKRDSKSLINDMSRSQMNFCKAQRNKMNYLFEEYPSLIIFKSLLTTRIITRESHEKEREEIPPQDLYHIFGFKIKNNCYEENFEDLSRIKRKISQANFRLRYYENGLRFQMKERIRYLTYKSMKQVLRTLANLLGVPRHQKNSDAIGELMDLYGDSESRQKLKRVVASSDFLKEIKSIVYKTIISYGLFPSFVEINTMAEGSLFLWVKKLVSNVVSAPWSSNYHASFSLGNHRYSFINVPDDKSKQNKVNVSLDLRRDFSSKTSKFDYFRLKFFDFFPMNSWIEEIAAFIRTIVEIFKTLEEDDGLSFSNLLKVIHYKLGEYMDRETFPSKIAYEFSKRYKELFCKEVRTTDKSSIVSLTTPRSANRSPDRHADWVFLKLTELVAEIRGYALFSHNCQTVVSEVVNLFCSNFQELVEPLLDVHTLVFAGDVSVYAKLEKNFSTFASRFNKEFEIKVTPFPLTHRLSYFGTYSDYDTYNLLRRENFERMKELFDKHFKKPNVSTFLTTVKQSYWTNIEKFQQTFSKSSDCSSFNVDTMTESQKSNANGMDSPTSVASPEKKPSSFTDQTPNTDNFSFISHLVYILYNELFTLRKKIKIKNDKISEVEQLIKNSERGKKAAPGSKLRDDIMKPKEQERKTKELEKLEKELQPLYQDKYNISLCHREVCYYYYNSIRLGVLTKFNDTTSYIGFLLIKNPEFKFENLSESKLVNDSVMYS